MNVTFYNNKSNNNVINKQLEKVNTINFNFKDNTDLLNPILILKNYEMGNYCYIDKLNKYYYIEHITVLTGGLFQIQCHIDVLKTYANDIINSDFYDSDGELFVIDNEINFNDIYDISKFIILMGG